MLYFFILYLVSYYFIYTYQYNKKVRKRVFIYVKTIHHRNTSFTSGLWLCVMLEKRILIGRLTGLSTGVRCEARQESRDSQSDGALNTVQEQYLRSGERSLPWTVLLRQ